MRVIAGSLGGRTFESPHSNRTHPMSDKMRGALFNILGDIEGLIVLDAFAGTGALCFEAVSRGAAEALAIEQDRSAQRIIAANSSSLGIGRKVKLIKASAGSWSQTNEKVQFDIVLCDPPYDDLQPNLLQRLAAHCKPSGIFVLSWPADIPLPQFDTLQILQQRTYGDATLVFYKSEQ
jgi:16S rRNA (guanine966-N2)-methyltransferase